jgi:hypothetical protein
MAGNGITKKTTFEKRSNARHRSRWNAHIKGELMSCADSSPIAQANPMRTETSQRVPGGTFPLRITPRKPFTTDRQNETPDAAELVKQTTIDLRSKQTE